jgi:transposase
VIAARTTGGFDMLTRREYEANQNSIQMSGYGQEKPKNTAVRQAIRAAGAKLFFLPPYSPDLNPIALAFSKLKTLLRKANARTIEQVEKCIARLLSQIDPAECLNYFQQAGYAST